MRGRVAGGGIYRARRSPTSSRVPRGPPAPPPPLHARLGMPASGSYAERGPVAPALMATDFEPTAQENEAVQLPTTPPSGQRARIDDLAA
jgi:hypothetical protein